MSPGRRVEVESSGIIDDPLEKLWDLVSDFSNVANWHPNVTECRLESGSARQAGAVRSVRLRNGISIGSDYLLFRLRIASRRTQ